MIVNFQTQGGYDRSVFMLRYLKVIILIHYALTGMLNWDTSATSLKAMLWKLI